MPAHEEKLNTVYELTLRFKVSDKTVRRWLAAGQLEYFHLGRQIRVPESAVKRFMDVRRRAARRKAS